MGISYTFQGVRVTYDAAGIATSLETATISFWYDDPADFSGFGTFSQTGRSNPQGLQGGVLLDEVSYAPDADVVLIDGGAVDPASLGTPDATGYFYEIFHDVNPPAGDTRVTEIMEFVDRTSGEHYLFTLHGADDLPVFATAADWNAFIANNLIEYRDVDFGGSNQYAPLSDTAQAVISDGADYIEGTEGDDLPFGAGPVLLDGGAGNDTIAGLGGDDIASLGEGDDWFIGGTGRDIVDYDLEWFEHDLTALPVIVDLAQGFAIDTYDDIDTLFSVEGAIGTPMGDRFIANDSGSDFYGLAGDDTITGGAGRDLLGYGFDIAGVTVDLATGTAVDGWGDTDSFTSIEIVSGSDFADTLRGDGGDNILSGRDGADLIEGLDGLDSIVGGAGDDSLNGGDGIGDSLRYDVEAGGLGVTVSLETGIATDSFGNTDSVSGFEDVYGTAFGDEIDGDASSNFLFGFEGDDILRGLDGNDFLFGDEGADTLQGWTGDDELRGGIDNDMLRGGAGFDLLFGEAGDDTLEGGANGDTLFGGGGIDDLNGQAGDDLVEGGFGNDSLQGGGGNDTLRGGEHNDRLHGGAEDDLLEGGSGNDVIYGADGNDTIDGGANNDYVEAGFGADEVSGGDGNDRIFGDEDDDVLNGDAGIDVLFGGAGFDTADGGIGNDFIFGGGGWDSLTGGEGDDRLDGGFGADSLFGGTGSDTLNGGEHYDLLRGGADGDDMSGGNGNDVMFGEAGNDMLDGGDGDDFLFGNSGDDNLTGGAGADTLVGDFGADILDGGSGADLIDGGVHGDMLTGGADADVFAFGLGDGNDTITDFEDGVDLILFQGTGLAFGDLAIGDAGADATVTGAGLGVITLNGVDHLTLTADDFDFG